MAKRVRTRIRHQRTREQKDRINYLRRAHRDNMPILRTASERAPPEERTVPSAEAITLRRRKMSMLITRMRARARFAALTPEQRTRRALRIKLAAARRDPEQRTRAACARMLALLRANHAPPPAPQEPPRVSGRAPHNVAVLRSAVLSTGLP
jgi:hypothetical protein